jgi:curved DNA-binding protein CbpA
MASASSGDNDEKKKSSNSGIRSGFLGKTGTDVAPLDKTYYNILNVAPTATASEIKKAYYSLSLQYHPDRTQNLNDITRREYSERFKLISQAYTILSDPEKRTLYNRYGKDERLIGNGSAGINLEDFDTEEFFRLMFGGEQFMKIIGEFELAKSFKHAISEVIKDSESKGTEETREQKEEKMRKRLAYAEERTQAREERVKQLSINLTYKLSVFTESIPVNATDVQYNEALNNFTQITRLDIPNLLSAPYGDHLLHAIGYIYASKAKLWLNKLDSQEGHFGKRVLGFGKHMQSSWKERVHVVKETVKTVKCAVEWGQSMSKLAQVVDEEAAAASEDGKDGQFPFQHHAGHLEYEGFVPSESTASASSASSPPPPPPTSSATTSKHLRHRKSAQPPVPLTEEQKRKLEADTAAKSMEALWRATKLEIESIERDVCDQVLGDPLAQRETRRRRCIALLIMGDLWQEARGNPTSSTSSDSP